MYKIQNKNKEKIQLAGTMKNKIVGMPLTKFQTPDVNKSKNKTVMSECLSSHKIMVTKYNNVGFEAEKQSTLKCMDSDDDEFERDDIMELSQNFDTLTPYKKSKVESRRNVDLLTIEESNILKS